MRARIGLVCIALLSVFIIACPMPQVGVGPTKDVAGGDPNGSPTAGGSISVVNDEARNQAVYINETGQRFDVVAEEYPGGPLVACVQVTDFTLVPASTDADALPVKALVTGMRDDGTPGVWEIHADDTIHLPQPEQTDDNAARCIVGGDMTTLPDGIQLRYGWTFETVAFSADARMIVGKAKNKRGAVIGGVQILPNTPIGVYWRVYSLPYSRFTIVSAPHIIGTIQPQTLPPKWRTRGHEVSDLLRQLKLFLEGKLESYLTEPFAGGVSLEVLPGMTKAAASAAGVYIVAGLDEWVKPATARIEKSGNITIAETLPDLELGTIQVPQSPVDFSADWTVNVALTNPGSFEAKISTLSYFISTSSTFSSDAKPILPVFNFTSIAANGSSLSNATAPISIENLQFTQDPGSSVQYFVFAFVTADATANYGLDLGMSAAPSSFTVKKKDATPPPPPPVLKVGLPAQLGPLSLNGGSTQWSFGVTVTLNGAATTDGTLDVFVKNDATPAVQESSVYRSVAIGAQVGGSLTQLDGLSGTHHVRVVAHVNGITAEATCIVPVKYDQLVIDTYSPTENTSDSTFGNAKIDLFGSNDFVTSLASGDVYSFNPDENISSFAYILYVPDGGLPPGDYYVRIQAMNPGETAAYVIRAATTQESYTNSLPIIRPRPSGWIPGTVNATATANDVNPSGPGYENDDNGGVPAASAPILHISDVAGPFQTAAPEYLNRYVAGGSPTDIDWVHLVLR